jgi:hypothetical protein
MNRHDLQDWAARVLCIVLCASVVTACKHNTNAISQSSPQVVLPLEVIGSDGYIETAVFNLNDADVLIGCTCSVIVAVIGTRASTLNVVQKAAYV